MKKIKARAGKHTLPFKIAKLIMLITRFILLSTCFFFLVEFSYSNDVPTALRISPLNQEQKVIFQKYKNKVSIQEHADKIFIQADNVPLGVLLRSIQIKTGIQFVITQSNWNDKVKVKYIVPDWKMAVNKILSSYNRVGQWNSNLNLSTIQILYKQVEDDHEYDNRVEFNDIQEPDIEPVVESKQQAMSQPKLSFDQLTDIAKGRLRSPLSPSLFDDEDIRLFLKQEGVKSIEDAEDIKKAMNVRVKARRKLREIE